MPVVDERGLDGAEAPAVRSEVVNRPVPKWASECGDLEVSITVGDGGGGGSVCCGVDSFLRLRDELWLEVDKGQLPGDVEPALRDALASRRGAAAAAAVVTVPLSASGPKGRTVRVGESSRKPGPGAWPDSEAISHACLGSMSHRRTERMDEPCCIG